MKTRSNMPLFVLEVSDVKALSNSQIDLLRCGDWLVKKDASGEHAYKVTFKSATGMCLTYHDASVIETQSYDKVEGNWVYNSEDKTPNLLDAQTEDDVIDLLGSGDVPSIKGDEIIENMSGYSFWLGHPTNLTTEGVYAGVVKNGNKITFAVAVNFTRLDTLTGTIRLGYFSIPKSIFDRLYMSQIGTYQYLTVDEKPAWSSDSYNKKLQVYAFKDSVGSSYNVVIDMNAAPFGELTLNTKYYFRYEFTLLLSDNLLP